MFSRIRWLIVWLMFLGGMINYMDRAAISVAAPLIAKDMHLDPAQLGLVFSCFFFGYALFCFVGGWASDHMGPKRVLGTSMAAWSVFCALTGAATSFVFLIVVRILFGMGEGPLCSTMNKFISQWFPRKEQATAVGLANAGTPLGGAIAGPVVGLIAISFGWRASFFAIGVIGIVWTFAWLLLATDRPAQNRLVSTTEQTEIAAGTEAPAGATPTVPLAVYLRRPTVLATAFAFFGYAYLLYFFLAWFPSYLTMARHLSVKSMSIVSVIPWLLGFIGLALGGFVCDAIFRRTGRAVESRKIVLVSCLTLAAIFVALAGLVHDATSAVALMGASVFFLYLTGNTYFSIILDTVEGPRVGSVSGFVHLIANCAGIVSPVITGLIVQYSGGFTGAFVLAGAMAVLGALGVAIFVRTPAAIARPVRPMARA